MNFHRIFFSSLAVVGMLAGCVSNGILIGEKPSDPPPKLAFLGARDAKSQDYLTWENVSSFGQVPVALKAAGDSSCMRLGLELRATGYHPHARDRNGREMAGGGFFCQVVLAVGYDSVPPRQVKRDRALAWDRPGAFGPIPDSAMTAAALECAKQNQKPLAYHPGALGEDGLPMTGGGFLCTP